MRAQDQSSRERQVRNGFSRLPCISLSVTLPNPSTTKLPLDSTDAIILHAFIFAIGTMTSCTAKSPLRPFISTHSENGTNTPLCGLQLPLHGKLTARPLPKIQGRREKPFLTCPSRLDWSCALMIPQRSSLIL